ncbi:hypothetical protein DFJ74DRAFT_675129 [Hyaloraphidium curvatum]|nr:hypothetical protein DFJ74DRAFT_675129 [Hyaloraphidium curvatum]
MDRMAGADGGDGPLLGFAPGGSPARRPPGKTGRTVALLASAAALCAFFGLFVWTAPAAPAFPAAAFPSRDGVADVDAVLARWTAHHEGHLRKRSSLWRLLRRDDPAEDREAALREAYAARAKEMMRMVLETNHRPEHARRRRQDSAIASRATQVTGSLATGTATALVTGSASGSATGTASATISGSLTRAATTAPPSTTTTTTTTSATPQLPLPEGAQKRRDFKDAYIYNPNTVRDPSLPLVPYASWNLTDSLRRNYTCELDVQLDDFEDRAAFEGLGRNRLGGPTGGGGMLVSYVNGTATFRGRLVDDAGISVDVSGEFIRLLNQRNVLVNPETHGIYLIVDENGTLAGTEDKFSNFVQWSSRVAWINVDQGRFDSIAQNGSIVPFSQWDQTQFNHTVVPRNMTHARLVGTLQDMRTINATTRNFTATVAVNTTFANDGMFYFVPSDSTSYFSTSFPTCVLTDHFAAVEFDLVGPPTAFGLGLSGCNASADGTGDGTLWTTVQHTEFRQRHSVPFSAVLAANMPRGSLLVCSPLDYNLAVQLAGAAVVDPVFSAEWQPILSAYSFVPEGSMIQRRPLFLNPALLTDPFRILSHRSVGNCSIFRPPASPPLRPANSTAQVPFQPYSFSIDSLKGLVFSGFQTAGGNFFYALDNITLAAGKHCKPSCPTKGRFHYGVNLDWWHDDPLHYIDRVGDRVRPTFYNMYTYVDRDETGSPFFASWNVLGAADRLLQLKYGPVILGIVVMPNGGLDTVTDAVVDDIARICKEVNDKGVYAHLIFAHEANGWWYPYGAQPAKYKEAWQRLATRVKEVAPFTRTVWPMNEAHSYPFGNTNYDPLLDTNNNGGLDPGDDPYTPYYPGDKYVDWAGLSLYHLGNYFPWGDFNEEALANKMINLIRGSVGYDMTPETATNFNFYDMFSVRRSKPMGTFETSATYYPNAPGVTRRQLQRSWWRQLYDRDTHENIFPMLRLIAWFEWAKFEDNVWKDWLVSDDPVTVDELMQDLPHDLVVKDYELVENCFL